MIDWCEVVQRVTVSSTCTIVHISLISVITSQLFTDDEAHLCPAAESFLCGFLVLSFAQPGRKSRGLKSTAVGEAQFPGAFQRDLVDGVQVEGGLFLALASRQEADACKG